jgi:alpha-D-xyloside xylohydrolase
MKNRKCIILTGLVCALSGFAFHSEAQLQTNAGTPYLLNVAKDMSADFGDFANIFFFADELTSFDETQNEGKILWRRYNLFTRQAFNTNTIVARPLRMLDFPGRSYDNNPELRFKLDFITPRTLRVRMLTTPVEPKEETSVMLAGEPSKDNTWKVTRNDSVMITYASAYGSISIERRPWRIVLQDAQGNLLTKTQRLRDNDSTQVKILPFNFIKRGHDNSRSLNPVFTLSPDEKIFGCGESFTKLDKVGQKVNLFTTDPQGPETDQMYKPVPFFMSNRGYGIFMHTSAPVTCDFGATSINAMKLFMGDESLDFFVFLGEPKDVLNEYTDIVGNAAMPTIWSFGTWMSRITYFSEKEGYEVAQNLRKHKIPSDVIHFDTGWFDVDWQCDYEFSPSRFPNPQKMINDLKDEGFRISLWQLPYFTPKNRFFPELIEKGLYVKDSKGELPYEDVVLDFSNPRTVDWYQGKIANLIRMGVGAIKVDFGEAAPLNAIYASGKTGLYEHNLYPLRYNKAVADITKEVSGQTIIWARSAWAGSQRYPLHWGGDAANTDYGMMGSLRGGLSIGLSGFSFWSHDIGGFVVSTPEELYRRWLPFGFLSSHSRAHGAPPTEPWLYNEKFVQAFRQSAELKYKLMPYVYAQAKECTEKGLPMLRALFIEYPDDAGAWLVEDEYMFGSQILVAPLIQSGNSRAVYLPQGKWIDYQTGKVYSGGYQSITSSALPAIILVRDGSAIPHIRLAQSTAQMDWSQINLKLYTADETEASGLVCLPAYNQLHKVSVRIKDKKVTAPGLEGRLKWTLN